MGICLFKSCSIQGLGVATKFSSFLFCGEIYLKATAMRQNDVLVTIVKIVMCTYGHHNTQQLQTYSHIQTRARTQMCVLALVNYAYVLLRHAPCGGFLIQMFASHCNTLRHTQNDSCASTIKYLSYTSVSCLHV